MKKYLIALAFLPLMACHNSGGKTDQDIGKQEFIVSDKDYSISFPDSATVSIDKIPMENGASVQQTTYMSSRPDQMAYSFSITQFPDSLIQPEKVKELLHNAEHNALIACDMTGDNQEKEILINGFPGIWFKARKTTGKQINYTEYRMYFVESTFYQLAVMKGGEWPSETETSDFFDSFRITKSQKKNY